MAKDKTRFKIRGIAVYPKTDRPYKWDNATSRSVADPEGSFELNVAVEAEKATGLRTALNKWYKENGHKGVPDVSIKEQLDKETGEPTGKMLVKIVQYGTDKSGLPRKLLHVDSDAKPLPEGFRLTSGSEIIVDCYPTFRKMPKPGVKLNIGAIQVVQYIEPQAYNPFEAVEGGYASEDDTEADAEAAGDEGNGEEGNSTDF